MLWSLHGAKAAAAVRRSTAFGPLARAALTTSAAKSGAAAAAASHPQTGAFAPTDHFIDRHCGPQGADISSMLEVCGFSSLDALTRSTVPPQIVSDVYPEKGMGLGEGMSEAQATELLQTMANKNDTSVRSFIGQGYYNCVTPGVVQRCLLENPGWYTSYTPYQAEIAQGRLEMLLNFQTAVVDLTGLPIANASLLDEATAAAEAMSMCLGLAKGKQRNKFFVDSRVHPQTLGVVRTRAEPLGVEVVVGDAASADFDPTYAGV